MKSFVGCLGELELANMEILAQSRDPQNALEFRAGSEQLLKAAGTDKIEHCVVINIKTNRKETI